MTDTEQREAQVSRRAFVGTLVGAGAVVAGAAVFGATVATQEDKTDKLIAHFRSGSIPAEDPEGGAWGDLPVYEVPLVPQQMTPPTLVSTVIPTLKVRAMPNGAQLAFQLRWEQGQANEIDAMSRFHDAVAVQLPTTAEAPAISMGQPGAPVHILQWRASWQLDIDKGRQTVEDAFPNMPKDLLRPQSIMTAEQSKVYYPGLYVGNPMSALTRTSPVEEMTSIGFGSLTDLNEQKAVGKGVFDGGDWTVAIGTSMAGGEEGRFTGDTATKVAFAAWNGGKDNRGSRKQYANWVDLHLEKGV
jgi:hypothetical protein